MQIEQFLQAPGESPLPPARHDPMPFPPHTQPIMRFNVNRLEHLVKFRLAIRHHCGTSSNRSFPNSSSRVDPSSANSLTARFNRAFPETPISDENAIDS